MPARPGVSVVIPTRNRCERLMITLAGVLRQENVELEVVVVDEGSTDETPARLASLGDERVRVLRNDQPAGVARARNHGIAEARGEWIAFLDDDDIWAPGKLRAQLDAASKGQAEWVYGAAVVVDERLRVRELLRAPDSRDLHRRLLSTCVVPAGGSNVIARSTIVRQLEGFDPELDHLADWDMWIRLASAGTAAALDQPLVGYVRHGGNMHMSDLGSGPLREFERLAAKHREAGRRNGAKLDLIEFSHWDAARHRLAGRRLDATRIYLRAARSCRSPGMLLRAVVTPLGETAMGAARAVRRGRLGPEVSDMAWLDFYR